MAAAPAKRSKARLVGGIVGAGALIGAGAFAFAALRDGASGGAGSPEDAVHALVDAINEEDVLGALDVVLPGERDTFKEPLVRLVEELERLEVLDPSADLADVGGVELQIELTDMTTGKVADDIVTVDVVGTVSGSVDAEQLPIGDLLLDEAFGGERPTGESGESGEASTFGTEDTPLRITTVERDGRWYVSIMYSIAESARVAADVGPVPDASQAVEPQGGSSPEEAMDQFLDRVVALDLEGVIASLNPNEAEALQRYAPLFLPDAEAAIDEMLAEAGLSVTIEDVQYDVETDGDQATLLPTSFALRAAVEGEEANVRFADGCLTVSVAGEEEQFCADDAEGSLDAFGLGGWSGLTGSGVRLDRVDGEWYVSPLGTMFDVMLTALEGVERADLEELIDGLQQGSFEPFEVLPGVGDLDDEATGTTVFTVDSVPPPAASVPDDTMVEDPTMDCYFEEEPDAALECFLAAQAEDPEVFILPALRFPECGIARYSWRYAWDELDDAAFIETVTAANACFEQKVAAGELEDWEVPSEVFAPECYDGINPYRIEDLDEQSAALSDYYDCAFA